MSGFTFWTVIHHHCERPPSLLSLRPEEQDIGVAELLLLLRLSPELERLHLVYCKVNNSDKLFSRIEEEELCRFLTDIDFRELWKPVMFNYKSLDIYKLWRQGQVFLIGHL